MSRQLWWYYKPLLSRFVSHKQCYYSQSKTLITEGEGLLPFTGDLYSSAIKHGVASLRNASSHLQHLAETRKRKLRDTISAIIEFEAGMKSLNQWLRLTEKAVELSPPDWEENTMKSR